MRFRLKSLFLVALATLLLLISGCKQVIPEETGSQDNLSEIINLGKGDVGSDSSSGREKSGRGENSSGVEEEREEEQETEKPTKSDEGRTGSDSSTVAPSEEVVEGEAYYSKEEVALYIHLYGELPSNYISKQEADQIGWSVKANDGLVIGGNKFGNREGLLPEKKGRQYYECDLVEGYGNNRGPVRLVYSNDGLIYYTDDHYESFTQLY